LVDLRVGNRLDLDTVIDVYVDSTLGERRPVDDRRRMGAMLANANLVVSAWDGDEMVGIARSISDFAFATYLSDLAVRRAYQGQGIGRRLIDRTQREGGAAKIVLLAAPASVGYYPHVGLERHDSAWLLPPGRRLETDG
jgi:ribosomal protein S18 acetylase RimI-like enzyme